MSDYTSFTDYEVSAIKHKLNEKFDRGLKIVILLTPLVCSLAPYIPGRKGKKALAENMSYLDAVLFFSIIWVLTLIGIWIWNNYRVKKEFSKNRKYLRKRLAIGEVKQKERTIFKSFDDVLITNLNEELSKIKITKEQSSNLNIGDEVHIEYEEHTKTILKINENSD